MNSSQIKAVIIAIIVVIFLWCVSPLLFSIRGEEIRPSRTPLSFDESAAHRIIQELVTQFPIRVLGSLESRQSTGYVHDYLGNLGYSFTYTHFDARINRRRQVGRNILAYRQGQSNEILALVAHLDTARTTNQGAMDNGSGVGVLLELARIFAKNPTRRSLLLILSDGEEWGMLGARDLANNYPDRNRIAAVLSLDHVAIGDMSALCLDETGQLKGFTPPWLRELARSAAQSEGLAVRSASGLSEFLDRALLISWADQGPFLSKGIPAINLGSESREHDREREIYHSSNDTIGNLKASSIRIYGRAAERIVRTLDETASLPQNAPDAFRFWDSRFVRAGVILGLQILSFVPLLLVIAFYIRSHSAQLNFTGAGREFLALLATVLPLWVIYFLIELARVLRLIPIYTLYPATLKDPVLQNPPWAVLAGIFGTAFLLAAAGFIIAKLSFRSLPKPDFRISKLVLLACLAVSVFLSLLYSPYWAMFFFILPVWIWPLAGEKAAGSLWLSRVMIFAAGIPYYAVLWMYAAQMDLRWNFAWYHVIALSNGLFTRPAYFLATAIVAIGIRFLAIQSHGKSA